MSKLTLEIPDDTAMLEIARMAATIGCRVDARADGTYAFVRDGGSKVVSLAEHGRRRMHQVRSHPPETPA